MKEMKKNCFEKDKNQEKTMAKSSGKENKSQSKTGISSGEYAENFRWWWYQQQCIYQMNMAYYHFLYNLHFISANNYYNQLNSVRATSSSVPNSAAFQQQPEHIQGVSLTSINHKNNIYKYTNF